jgi:hypothetical protein
MIAILSTWKCNTTDIRKIEPAAQSRNEGQEKVTTFPQTRIGDRLNEFEGNAARVALA